MTLKSLGADSQAKDAARVLRLVGTCNSKSGTPVETIWQDRGDAIWGFDDVANELLPFSREELEELRAQRRGENRQKIASKGRRKPSVGREDIEKRFTLSTLALGRLSDLQRLLKLRSLDKLPPGQRNAWMFAAGSSLAYLVEPEFLERELIVLGRENADWSDAETRSSMHSIISRAKDASNKGGTVEWQGQERDPRYRLTNQKIIDDLNITTAEEKEMKVIISSDTKRQRNRERKERERRSKGVIPRDEYLAEAREKRRLALELHQQGRSLREIGKTLGISHTQVKRMLEAQQQSQQQ